MHLYTELQELHLPYCFETPRIAALPVLPRVQYMVVNCSGLTDDALPALGKLHSLSCLDLSQGVLWRHEAPLQHVLPLASTLRSLRYHDLIATADELGLMCNFTQLRHLNMHVNLETMPALEAVCKALPLLLHFEVLSFLNGNETQHSETILLTITTAVFAPNLHMFRWIGSGVDVKTIDSLWTAFPQRKELYFETLDVDFFTEFSASINASQSDSRPWCVKHPPPATSNWGLTIVPKKSV
jgi:hypothetical protein